MTKGIFLSYSSDDADTARRICDALRAAGLEVWFDQSELRGGDAWDASIRKQIKECASFVPVISASTDARPEGYFRLEWKLAVDRSHLMADDQPFFVPVILDNTPERSARVPEKFRERQWTRLTDDASTNAFAERIAKLIGGSASPGKSASRSPSNGEFAHLPNSSQSVAPETTQRESAAQISSTPRRQVNVSPVHQRDDSVASAAATRRTRVIAAIAALVVIACAATAWFVVDHNRKQAFIAQNLTNIESLSRSTKYMEAYRLAREVEIAGGAALLTDAIRESYSRVLDVTSTPEGASISIREYRPEANEQAWIDLGTSPLTKLRVPRGVIEWRASMPQKVTHTLVALTTTGGKRAFSLPAADAKGADMLPVPGFESNIGSITGLTVAQGVKLKPFSIDRTEVTNRQYASFVQAGGYSREEYWKHPFQDGTKLLSFGEAMARFKDATGRPEPATWKLGSFPDGEGDLPV